MRIILCLLLAAAWGVAAPGARKASAKSRKASVGEPLKVPKNAEEIRPGMHRHTDAKGRIWIYRQTPTGLVRYEENDPVLARFSPDAPERQQSLDRIAVVEDGDLLRFERPGPVGPMRWERKKTELNATERVVWERAQEKNAQAAAADAAAAADPAPAEQKQ
ncbi:MAG: hypothetical protein FJW37_12175 [Acidobacteria bacterium]|nr:hypothetical protein [Acidobacteriota bacterium]